MSRVSKSADQLLQRLAVPGALAVMDGEAGRLRVVAPGRPSAKAEYAAARELVAEELAAQREDGAFFLTGAGRARASRLREKLHPHLAQHAQLDRTSINDGEHSVPVLIDASESPLAWLARRKGKDGQPLLAAAAVEAGERFRAHVTLARTLPRTTSSWSMPTGGARGGPGGGIELTDAVLSAQQKVRKALDAVGPELSGILLDVCGFLKGLEDVERERSWPPRTAKVVLGLALERLARHYGLSNEARGDARRGTIRHWRAEATEP